MEKIGSSPVICSRESVAGRCSEAFVEGEALASLAFESVPSCFVVDVVGRHFI